MQAQVEQENEKRNSTPTVLPSLKTRRFEKPGDASKELFDAFNEWSRAVGTYGVHTAYAVIAANWAVHRGQGIMSNPWAKWSLGVAIAFRAIHLVCTGGITWLLLRQIAYANNDKVVLLAGFTTEGASAAALATAQSDLDKITGAAGAVIDEGKYIQ